MEICEEIRHKTHHEHFPTRVREAVARVLAKEHLEYGEFFRYFAITCTAHHWIGRGLSVCQKELESALNAWHVLHEARGQALFQGGMPGPAYTPEKADKQWKQVKAAFVMLQTENGRARPGDLEGWFAQLEVKHRPVVLKTVARWERAQRTKWEKREAAEAFLYRRAVSLVAGWARAVEQKKRQDACAKGHTNKTWGKRSSTPTGPCGESKRRKKCDAPDDVQCEAGGD